MLALAPDLVLIHTPQMDSMTTDIPQRKPKRAHFTPCSLSVTGSPAMSGFYGIRRSFLSDSDFHSSKQFPGDACSSGVAKPFSCEPSAAPSHPALLEPYFQEPYSDHRSSALTPSPSSLFSASPLPPLLSPPFPGDPAHLVLVSGSTEL